MPRQEPVVNTGMKTLGREARIERSEASNAKREVGAGIYARISALLKGKTPEPVQPATPYEVVFQSKYRRHRVQIDAPADVIDARGRKTQGRTLFAQFQNSHFSIPKFIKPLARAEEMLEILYAHPNFNRDFWEEKDNTHEIRVAQVARVVDMLEKNEDIKDTILDYLTERDFVDPLLKDSPTADEIAAGVEDDDPPPARRLKRKPARRSHVPRASA